MNNIFKQNSLNAIVFESEADIEFSERGWGGMGCRVYGNFILGHFAAVHIMQCIDKTLMDKMPVDKMLVKIAGEDKMQTIFGTRGTKCPAYQNT